MMNDDDDDDDDDDDEFDIEENETANPGYQTLSITEMMMHSFIFLHLPCSVQKLPRTITTNKKYIQW